MYLLRLADILEIDLIQAVQDKIAVNQAKYPVDQARGLARKYIDLRERPGTGEGSDTENYKSDRERTEPDSTSGIEPENPTARQNKGLTHETAFRTL